MNVRFFTIKTLILCLLLPSSAYAFPDVNVDDYHYVPIQYLEENGIIDGYDDGTFRANNNINRAEALKMLALASSMIEANDSLESPINNPFTDTPIGEWYSPYVQAAKDAEVISGYSDGSFKPEQNVNLVEALKIYLEALGNTIFPPVDDYLVNDTPADEWFTKYTAHAIQRNMLIIYPSNEIYPDQEISRGYLAEIIYRKKMGGQGYDFGKATYYGSALHGNRTASGETFDMYAMTAAHLTLPFGTIVEVTNLHNGKSIQVKINDRGPYGAGRVIDLSEAAFEEIASLSSGVINVQYRVVE